MSPVETVCKYMSAAEVLTQLAEEAAELAQAALKLRRAITGTNPTPRSLKECEQGLIEELADVNTCLTVLDSKMELEWEAATNIIGKKMARWAQRLEAANADTAR
jgi:NTP pyrophosphatase (non-canonical NTP hydrolase)